jgi:hypothetical protein
MPGPLAYVGRYVRWRVCLRGTNHGISVRLASCSWWELMLSHPVSFSTSKPHLDLRAESLPDILFPAKLDKVLI